jgi:hypothetical protein
LESAEEAESFAVLVSTAMLEAIEETVAMDDTALATLSAALETSVTLLVAEARLDVTSPAVLIAWLVSLDATLEATTASVAALDATSAALDAPVAALEASEAALDAAFKSLEAALACSEALFASSVAELVSLDA